MAEKLLKKLKGRLGTIVFAVNKILIVAGAISLCLMLVLIGMPANVDIRTPIVICFIIFLVSVTGVIVEGVALFVLLVVDAAKRDGILKLLKGFIIIYPPLVAIRLVIDYARGRSVDWIDAMIDCLIPVCAIFLYMEIDKLTKKIGKEIENKEESQS